LGDSSANANGFNDNGEIVGNGYHYYPNGLQEPTRPLYWSSPTAAPSILAVPANMLFAIATKINNSGHIVGYAITPSYKVTPLYWASPTDTPEVLQSIADMRLAPDFIGANGNIIAGFGSAYDDGENGVAFWSDHSAQPVALNGLTGSTIVCPLSANAAGVIVGYCVYDGYTTPVIWANADASPQALPLPYWASGFNYAWSINATGVIVGTIGNYNYVGDCAVWKDGQVQDVAVLTNNFSLGDAKLITDSGWILGNAHYGYYQYILIPK
jgi:uncharacterized membrane protein